ncbi:cutinase family protein [Mycolicibacterium smegmatis]|uniref:cutinase family protein n=1 Tax=Mycolicibacterium smegmatis TaxID=1772 RepID=UPI0020A457CD|nr:cutinase family protein [Mycolicibacterium smegmatis]MCP2624585.1 cutinase family protein [Mycolicibacterium smegmatis]
MITRRISGLRAGCARSARVVAIGASALFAVGVALAVPGALPVASADDCADAEVVFARGTDEPAGLGRVGTAFVDALRKQAAGLDIDAYAVDYKAGKLQLSGGDGAKDAIAHIKSTVSSCPDTKIVLGGYSQGASVVNIVAGNQLGGITWADPLPAQYADNVAAIVTFGDIATRTKEALSTRSNLFSSKAIDLCNPSDPICHEGQGNEWSGHTDGYVPVYTTQAAVFAASKLLAESGRSVPGYGSVPEYGPGYQPGYEPEYGPGSGPAYGPLYGPATPGYDPESPTHGPPPGYVPAPPGYVPETPGYAPPTPSGPTRPSTAESSPDVGLVSAIS